MNQSIPSTREGELKMIIELPARELLGKGRTCLDNFLKKYYVRPQQRSNCLSI